MTPVFSIGDWADYRKMADRMVEVAKDQAGVAIQASHGAWTFCLSYGEAAGWIFSAKLRQRHSKERDWAVPGQVVARVGAPDEMPDTVRTSHEASHYWSWGGSTPSAEVQSAADLVRDWFSRRGDA